jgi:hypothetical protein
MFGRWRRKTGFFWKSWQIFKRWSPYGSQIEEVGRITGIGQGRRQAKQ